MLDAMSSAAKKLAEKPRHPLVAAFEDAPIDPEDETPEQRELIRAGEKLPKVPGRVVSAEIAARFKTGRT
jgi:hypothetical protein